MKIRTKDYSREIKDREKTLKQQDIIKSDQVIAEIMQAEELVKLGKSQAVGIPAGISLFPEKERQITRRAHLKEGNACNRYDDLSYWYEDTDITAIASLLIKDFENISFVGTIGRSQYQSVDAEEILRSKKVDLSVDKRLVGIYNTGRNHWIAFIIFKDLVGRTTCCYKDSLGKETIDFEYDIKAVFTGVKINCLQKGQAEQKLEYDNKISGRNGLVSCGVFALKNLGTLARCGNIDECWNARYYSPGDNEDQYRDTLKCNRKEYGLLYARSTYDSLQESEIRLKDLCIRSRQW
jgi:hypothetical protein